MMNVTTKNLSIIGALVIAISTVINITFSFIVPRYEINEIVEELTYEINRIEIRMVERELTRIEENKCRLSSEDINEMAYPILRHRIILNFEAERKGMTTDDAVKHILDKVK